MDKYDIDDNKKPKWVKATNGGKTGWVSSEYIRPDKERTIELSKYGLDSLIKIKVTFKDKTTETREGTPAVSWLTIGGGSDYPSICQKVDGKWMVAVGPAILDELYPDNGKCNDTDIKPFSKLIEVKLKLKNVTKDTKKEDIVITKEFFVADIKAHTFNKYKYSNLINKTKDAGHYISDGVEDVVITPTVRSGMIQTGIRYPNASNSTVVARIRDKDPRKNVNNIDYSIIEFCGRDESSFTRFADYELVSIRTNYEKKTRGKLYDYFTGKEK